MAKQNLLTVIDQALDDLKAARLAIATKTPSESGSKLARKPNAPRRVMSEEGRQKVAEAQRKRWAKLKRAAEKAARLAAK